MKSFQGKSSTKEVSIEQQQLYKRVPTRKHCWNNSWRVGKEEEEEEEEEEVGGGGV